MKLFLLGILYFIAARLEAQSFPSQVRSKPHPSDNTITYKIITVANGTYCYDIFTGGRRIIHQSSIPGLPGNTGFRRKQDASKVAGLVVEKLNKHAIPPSVTFHEMDSLKIDY